MKINRFYRVKWVFPFDPTLNITYLGRFVFINTRIFLWLSYEYYYVDLIELEMINMAY